MARAAPPPDDDAVSRLARLEREMEALALRRDLAVEGDERSDAHHHPAEAATDAEARERALRSHVEALDRQDAARRAKEAVAAGTYGRCSACGEQIPEARLRIRPDAERCVPCQTLEDRRR